MFKVLKRNGRYFLRNKLNFLEVQTAIFDVKYILGEVNRRLNIPEENNRELGNIVIKLSKQKQREKEN